MCGYSKDEAKGHLWKRGIMTIWPLGDGTSCTHRSKEVAVPASLTVVPLNPAMAWGHEDMACLVAPSAVVRNVYNVI